MNIREVEGQLGIPRASVRYYEKEGLLHPARSGNNYRVYTQEDVETLKKIQLLRRLDMPIETIRAVQSGEVSLQDAAARQLELLESSAARLEQARAVCRALLEDQAAYPALDPSRYEKPAELPWADRVARRELPEVPPVEGAVWAYGAVQRWAARLLDTTLTELAVIALLAMVFHINATENSLPVSILSVAMSWCLVLVLEPLLLSTWGTTPGKWLLGLELRDRHGRKLSFTQALFRTWGVLRDGYGFEIPFYNYYRQYKCYKLCQEEKPAPYDLEDGNLYYSLAGDRWGFRAFLVVCLSIVLMFAGIWVGYQAILPPNRGDITPAEFFENVNFQSRRLGGDLGYELWLNEEGYELADQTMDVRTGDGPWIHYVYGEPFDNEPVYRVETDGDGYVTAVVFEQEEHFAAGDEGSWVWLPTGRMNLAILAFYGTRGSGMELMRNPLGKGSLETLWTENAFTDQRNGFTLTVELEQEGFQNGSNFNTLLIPETEGGARWYRFAVRLEKDA